MIYLFNSGFYNEYVVNILNTLHLPNGMENTFRYSAVSERNFVQDKLYTDMPSDGHVMIIFIDRYANGGFKFYPLRKGKLLETKRVEKKIFFKVELLDHYAIDDIDEFNNTFSSDFSEFVPKLNVNGNPEEDGSGFFVFQGRDISNDYKTIINPWSRNVERLSKVRIFKDEFVVFTKLDIIDSRNRHIDYGQIKGINRFKLKKQETYSLSLSYYFHEQERDNQSHVEIEVVEKIRSFGVSNTHQIIRNKSGLLNYEINTNKFPDNKYECIEIKPCNSCDSNRNLLFTDAPVNISLVNSKLFWFEIGFYALLIGVIRLLLDIDPSAIVSELTESSTVQIFYEKILLNIARMLLNYKYVYQTFLNILSSLLTFVMFWRFGKKVM